MSGRDGLASSLDKLFSPARFGSCTLRNRVAMAPMTRSQSPGHVPNARNVEYYRRRAAGGVGLIITEGTAVGHPAANGYPDVPAFHGAAALAGWRAVAEAVHAEGAAIIPQLWHVGSVRQPGTQLVRVDARGAQHRSTLGQQPVIAVVIGQLHAPVLQQPAPPVLKSDHRRPVPRVAGAYHRPDDRVQPWTVTTAGENSDPHVFILPRGGCSSSRSQMADGSAPRAAS